MNIKITVIFACFHFSMATAGSFPAGSCSAIPESKTCIDATPCKQTSSGDTVCLQGVVGPQGALNSGKSCWQYGYKYACVAAGINTCSQLQANAACSLLSSNCSTTNPSTGLCSQHDYTYQCKTTAATYKDQLVCSSGLIKTQVPGDLKKPNQNFEKTALASEILRQASTYTNQGVSIFSGVMEQCTKGYFGLKNCCNSAPGAQSNAVLMHAVASTAFTAVKYVGGKAVDTVSPYVFDAMFNNGIYNTGMLSTLQASSNVALDEVGGIIGTSFAANPSLSLYGFTFSRTTSLTEGLWNGGGVTLEFDPYMFAATVALQVLQAIASCSQGEQLLALHRGANLSQFMREECTNKIPLIGTCIEWTSTYCSFNSVLAKLINIQGKPQISLPVSDCAGLSVDQISRIDYNKIDFSQFTNQMVQQAIQAAPTDVKNNYTPVIQNMTSGSSQKLPSMPKY